MYSKQLTYWLAALSFCVCSPLQAAKMRDSQRILLPSCDVIITANEFQTTEKGTTYSGDVRILIGFANLRVNKITLIKKPDGHCELVSEK